MKSFHVTVKGWKYTGDVRFLPPSEYLIAASNPGVAARIAIMRYREDNPRKRIQVHSTVVVDKGEIINASDVSPRGSVTA